MSIGKYKAILKQAHSDIDPQAVGIIRRLKESGFDGYLVGGGVRDLLVGLKPKDFDIATNALPSQVKKKVPYCYIIGRRFKLVHARRGEKIFEVATYRREATQEELESSDHSELHFVEENFFGSLKEDSFRRDFTINALFYDPLAEELVDHCGGLDDIASQTLRVIGDPATRIKEDPIRILRAIRLSQKLEFKIESELRRQIFELSNELQRSVLPRRREEWLKIFKLNQPDLALWELYDLGILNAVLPGFAELWTDNDKHEEFLALVRRFKLGYLDDKNPLELFAGIVYSYLIAQYGFGFKIDEVSENTRFQIFCKEELGVFKNEVIAITMAIQMIQNLSRHDSYLKKGERRRKAVLRNDHFDLALKLGLISGELTPQDYLFWTNEKLQLLSPQNDSLTDNSNPDTDTDEDVDMNSNSDVNAGSDSNAGPGSDK